MTLLMNGPTLTGPSEYLSLVFSAVRLAFSTHTFSFDICLLLSLFPAASGVAKPLEAAF